MRVERVYDWKIDDGFTERDPQVLDPGIRASQTVRLGHLSDTHLGKGQGIKRLPEMRRWLDALEGLDVEVIVHSGDLIEVPDDREQIDAAFSVIDDIDVPLLGVPGNHDVQTPGQTGEVTRRLGPFPRTETVGDLEFLLLDSMAWPPAGERSQREQDSAQELGTYTAGGVGPKQRQRLVEQLDDHRGNPRVLVVHHHLRQPVPQKPWYEENADLMAPLKDADELLALARDNGVELILHGHRHQYVAPYGPFSDLAIINGTSATSAGWPKRARIIDMAVDGGALRIWELARYK